MHFLTRLAEIATALEEAHPDEADTLDQALSTLAKDLPVQSDKEATNEEKASEAVPGARPPDIVPPAPWPGQTERVLPADAALDTIAPGADADPVRSDAGSRADAEDDAEFSRTAPAQPDEEQDAQAKEPATDQESAADQEPAADEADAAASPMENVAADSAQADLASVDATIRQLGESVAAEMVKDGWDIEDILLTAEGRRAFEEQMAKKIQDNSLY